MKEVLRLYQEASRPAQATHNWADKFRRAMGWNCFLTRKADGALDHEFVRDQVRAMPAGVFIGQVHFENRGSAERPVYVARFCECDECVNTSLNALRDLQCAWRFGVRHHDSQGEAFVVN